ncbi:MAG: response regulator transcription factor [Actinomycetota bacterium]
MARPRYPAGTPRVQKARSGWEALTETERSVANLVARGMSNSQIAESMFLSRRTVQAHVSHASGKLGLTSRAGLAAEAARRSD